MQIREIHVDSKFRTISPILRVFIVCSSIYFTPKHVNAIEEKSFQGENARSVFSSLTLSINFYNSSTILNAPRREIENISLTSTSTANISLSILPKNGQESNKTDKVIRGNTFPRKVRRISGENNALEFLDILPQSFLSVKRINEPI